MLRSVRAVAVLVCFPAVAWAELPVAAEIETTLATAGGRIRQFAFDGDASSYFGSEKDAGRDDHFTLRFDMPVAVKAIDIMTGKPKGGDALDDGILEVSADCKSFMA